MMLVLVVMQAVFYLDIDILASANADLNSVRACANTTGSGGEIKLNLFEGIIIDSAYQNEALRTAFTSVLLETGLPQPPPLFSVLSGHSPLLTRRSLRRDTARLSWKSSCSACFLSLRSALEA